MVITIVCVHKLIEIFRSKISRARDPIQFHLSTSITNHMNANVIRNL